MLESEFIIFEVYFRVKYMKSDIIEYRHLSKREG